jgi:post-segregation antitoxin (ccd killing protein)
MDVTVYLPDEIGQWAKDAELNLSGLLREAVLRVRRGMEAAEETASHAKVVELSVADDDGFYTARLHGTKMAQGSLRPREKPRFEIYITESGEVVSYHPRTKKLYRAMKGEELRGILDDKTYIAVMRAAGQEPIIDIGKASR